MVGWVSGAGTGSRRRPHRAVPGIRVQACTLLLAGAVATVAPAARGVVSGIKAAGGRPGTAVNCLAAGAQPLNTH